MGKTDKLSRWPDWKVGVNKDNENQVVIKNCWLYGSTEVVIEEPKVGILEKIKITRSKNEEVVRIVKEMRKAGVKVLRGEE